VDAAARAVQTEREPEVKQIQRLQALPPRILLNDTWWTRAILALVPLLAGSRLTNPQARAIFRRFAFGMSEVRLTV
jgi:hypothetical protein